MIRILDRRVPLSIFLIYDAEFGFLNLPKSYILNPTSNTPSVVSQFNRVGFNFWKVATFQKFMQKRTRPN